MSADAASRTQGIAVARHVFPIHHRPFDLGLGLGLTLFLPAALLVLVTGLFADRHGRRAIVGPCCRRRDGAALVFLGLVIAHVDRLAVS